MEIITWNSFLNLMMLWSSGLSVEEEVVILKNAWAFHHWIYVIVTFYEKNAFNFHQVKSIEWLLLILSLTKDGIFFGHYFLCHRHLHYVFMIHYFWTRAKHKVHICLSIHLAVIVGRGVQSLSFIFDSPPFEILLISQ